MEEKNEYVDLYTLLATVKAGLGELFPLPVWVRAEISSLSVRANGHCYMELSQSENGILIAKQRATVWRSRFALLNARFQKERKEALNRPATADELQGLAQKFNTGKLF